MTGHALGAGLDRETFLGLADVDAFVTWLVDNLPTLQVDLRVRSSSFVPGGLEAQVIGIEAVQACYRWKGDWATVSQLLATLRQELRTQVQAGDHDGTFKACVAILDWGNVPSSAGYLDDLRQQGVLVQYLQDIAPLLSPKGNQRLSDLTRAAIPRFNSGLTKVHALLDDAGSPIYDGRVGAAIAMLYHLYRASPAAVGYADHRMFGWGPGYETPGADRQRQIRNPRLLARGLIGTPQLLGHASPHIWARRQVILGWIMREVLARSGLFRQEGADLAGRCHMLESSLFMVGYDLRCLVPGGWLIPDPVRTPRASPDESAGTAQQK